MAITYFINSVNNLLYFLKIKSLPKIPFEKCPKCGKKPEKRCRFCSKECNNEIFLPKNHVLRKLKVERLIKKQMKKNHNFKSSLNCLRCGKEVPITENASYQFGCFCGYNYP